MIEIRNPEGLAKFLAERAQAVQKIVLEILEQERSQHQRAVLQLYLQAGDWAGFSGELAGEVPQKEEGIRFSDFYAQLSTYLILILRWMAGESGQRFQLRLIDQIPISSAIKKRLIEMIEVKHPRIQEQIEQLFYDLSGADIISLFEGITEPTLYLYEKFLGYYDKNTRNNRGVFYTPKEVVSHIVFSAHHLLQSEFGLPLGLADESSWGVLNRRSLVKNSEIEDDSPFVQIVDPAIGTGAFLKQALIVIRDTMRAHWISQGINIGRLPELWRDYLCKKYGLFERLMAFEVMPVPYIIAQLQLGFLLEEHPDMPFSISSETAYLNISLSDPLQKKQDISAVTVIIGNPPYRRLKADEAHLGGWVREELMAKYNQYTSMAGFGGDLKNSHNLYIYFWRWADWMITAHAGYGLVSLVTAASYLHGNAFYGLRKHWRDIAQQLYILDLEGNQRGFRITENIFAIQTPVAIASLVIKPGEEFTGWYKLIEGSAEQKKKFCQEQVELGLIDFQKIRGIGGDSFLVQRISAYQDFPALTAIFPWQHSGCQFKRIWPIAESRELLIQRVKCLLEEKDSHKKEILFKEGDRSIHKRQRNIYSNRYDIPIVDITEVTDITKNISSYAYRAFDRRFCIADNRVCSRPRKELWRVRSSKQIYCSGILKKVNTCGPIWIACVDVPDLDFLKSGGKDVIPLYLDAEGRRVNINDEIIQKMRLEFGLDFPPEQIFYYIYAILGSPSFVEKFSQELRVPQIRVPITKDFQLFQKGVALGRQLLWIQTFGERGMGDTESFLQHTRANCLNDIPEVERAYPDRFIYDRERNIIIAQNELGAIDFVGDLVPAVFDFSISGMKPVQSWLDYRKKNRAGKSSSPLDDIRPSIWQKTMTEELLRVLHLIENSLALYPQLEILLEEILNGSLFSKKELQSDEDIS